MKLAPRMMCIGLLLSACSDDPAAQDTCGEPSYGGDATDEAWLVMVDTYDDAAASVDAPVVTSPTAAQVLAKSATPPTFAWTSRLAALAPRAWPQPASLLDLAGELWGGAAHAHLPPITGDVYYVEVKVPGRACAVSTLTTELSWTPSGAEWEAMQAATGPLTLVITSAYLTENRVTEGPFRAAAGVTFEVR